MRAGGWRPAVPEPLWVGPFLRVARCECGRRFWWRPWERYRDHWLAEHEVDHFFSGIQAQVEIEEDG